MYQKLEKRKFKISNKNSLIRLAVSANMASFLDRWRVEQTNMKNYSRCSCFSNKFCNNKWCFSQDSNKPKIWVIAKIKEYKLLKMKVRPWKAANTFLDKKILTIRTYKFKTIYPKTKIIVLLCYLNKIVWLKFPTTNQWRI